MKEMIYRFGIPHTIITDNESNFDSDLRMNSKHFVGPKALGLTSLP